MAQYNKGFINQVAKALINSGDIALAYAFQKEQLKQSIFEG